MKNKHSTIDFTLTLLYLGINNHFNPLKNMENNSFLSTILKHYFDEEHFHYLMGVRIDGIKEWNTHSDFCRQSGLIEHYIEHDNKTVVIQFKKNDPDNFITILVDATIVKDTIEGFGSFLRLVNEKNLEKNAVSY